jgi:hypothetical protein
MLCALEAIPRGVIMGEFAYRIAGSLAAEHNEKPRPRLAGGID